MVVARVALLLHKTPDEVRAMSIADITAILHLVHCENKKREENQRIEEEKAKFRG
jgi:hypothetical protein